MLKDSEVSAGCPGWELDRWGMAECSYKASSVNVSSLVASVCVVALCDDWRWLLCGPVTLTPHALLLDLQVSGLWLGEGYPPHGGSKRLCHVASTGPLA